MVVDKENDGIIKTEVFLFLFESFYRMIVMSLVLYSWLFCGLFQYVVFNKCSAVVTLPHLSLEGKFNLRCYAAQQFKFL